MNRVIKIRSEVKGPVKTVTIRDVNKALYDQFSLLSTRFGDNTGQIFSHLIENYGKQYHPFFLTPGVRFRHMFQHDHTSVEVISDLDELHLSKTDLEASGEEMRYMFRDIKDLTFDSTVDNRTLMRYVLRIKNCSVTTQGDVSKLFLKSINQGLQIDQHYLDLDPELTNVTIRNVSEEAYNQFTTACQTNRTKIGDAVNELLKRALPHFEITQIMLHDPKLHHIDLIILTLHDQIEVNNQDLVDLENRKVLFHRIRELTFNQDISLENFKQKVIGIYNCQQVKLPDSVPSLLQLSRVSNYP